MKSKALFLDRDGVINRERGTYTFRVEDFEILPTVVPTLKKAQELGYLLIIITNQGGIAKGLYTHEDVRKVHQYLSESLRSEGIELTQILYDPHHQDYSNSLGRKPGSLLFEKAIALHNIDTSLSFMIGDSDRDIVAANKVDVTGFKVEPNEDISFILNHLS